MGAIDPGSGSGTLTARSAVEAARGRLAAAGVPTPDVDAELLVLHAAGWSRTQLVMRGGDPLDASVVSRLQAGVARRERREPLQLIIGSVGFRYLDIEVRPGVFIPRPETEVLVEHAVEKVPAHGVVIEPCTGTGAVACAVAGESGAAQVLATDVSPDAVALAADNAVRNQVSVTIRQGDLFAPLPRDLRGSVDVVVSNPPYLADKELPACDPEVRDWDPVAALVAGPTGFELSDRLVRESLDWLAPGGWLLLEVDTHRAEQTAQRAREAGYTHATVQQDLTGLDRFVIARV